jgi:hypothetical protein
VLIYACSSFRSNRQTPGRSAIRPDWFTPSTLASMVQITDKVLAELGEPNRSGSAKGARSKSTAFEWVIGGSGDRARCDG